MNIFETVAKKYAYCKAVIVAYVRRTEADMKGKSGAEKRAYVVEKIDEMIKLPFWLEWADGLFIGIIVDKVCNALNILTDHGDWSEIKASDDTIAAVSELDADKLIKFEKEHSAEDVNAKFAEICAEYGIEADCVKDGDRMTDDFRRSEFSCKCGCGSDNIHTGVVLMLQRIRTELGEPITVNSGYRCEKHNKAVGGVDNSYHTRGLAADITCRSGAKKIFDTVKRMHAEGKLPELSFCQYYQKQNFVHVDCGGTRKAVFSVK